MNGYYLLGKALSNVDEERQMKRQQLQLQAKQSGYNLDSNGGVSPDAQTANMEALMSDMNNKLKELQKYQAQQEAFQYFNSDLQAGSYDNLNKLITNSQYSEMFKGMGYGGIRPLNRDSEADVNKVKNIFAQMGYKSNDIQKIMYGDENFKGIMNDDATWSSIVKSYPVVTMNNDKQQIVGMDEVAATLGLNRLPVAQQALRLAQDNLASTKQAMSGKLQAIVDLEKQAVETKVTSDKLSLDDMQKFLDNNPNATLADYIALQKPVKAKTPVEQATDLQKLKTEQLKQTKTQLEIDKLTDDKKQKIRDLFKTEDAARSNLDNSINLVDSLIKHPGRESATGFSYPLSFIPGTSAKDFSSAIDVIKSNIFLSSIQQMKGFGALSDAEGKKLDSAIASLDLGQTEGTMVSNLNIIKDIFTQAKARLSGTRIDNSTTTYSDEQVKALENAGFTKGEDGLYRKGSTVARIKGAQ